MNRIYYSLQQKKKSQYFYSLRKHRHFIALFNLSAIFNDTFELNQQVFYFDYEQTVQKYYLTRSERRRIPER